MFKHAITTVKRKTTEVWEAEDPVLKFNELAVEILSENLLNIKKGDGVSSWVDLPYFYKNQSADDTNEIIDDFLINNGCRKPVEDFFTMFGEGKGLKSGKAPTEDDDVVRLADLSGSDTIGTATPTANKIAKYNDEAGLKSDKEPAESNDVIRKTELDAHKDDTAAHGATAVPAASKIAAYNADMKLKSGAAAAENNDVMRFLEFSNEVADINSKISTLNGAYYVLDAYDFGKTLDETDPDDILILNTYAIANTPGASSMADVYNDTVVINEFDTSEFVYNKISGLWVKYPNGYLTIATNDHLGVVKGTQPPADPTDESKDIYVQVLPDGSMRLVGDRLGKINTVNGISPDTNKNVQTDYIYETEADFEADKNNIPVGATVIKLYEYPDNHPYDLNRPDLWPLNTEIDFGGGLFGQHKAGTFTDTAERAVNRVVMLTLTGAQVAPESTFRLVDFGGNWQPNASMAMAEPVRGTNTYPESSIAQWSNFWVDMDNKWVAFRSWTLSARTGCTYDVWFTYKK